jgi:hypothetical protein
VGNRLPGVNAGPSFELQIRNYFLPHRREAFVVLQERMLELGGHAERLSRLAPSKQAGEQLKAVEGSLLSLAKGLQGAVAGDVPDTGTRLRQGTH